MRSTFLTSRLIRHKNRGAAHTVLMEGSTVSTYYYLCLLLILQPSLANKNFSLTAYMSSPCHIELILSEKEESVKKEVSMNTSGYY